MLTKPQIAQKRNYMLFRLTGMNFGQFAKEKVLNPSEVEIFEQMEKLRRRLMDNWDGNSAAIGLIIRPHKCSCCGKRSDKAYYIKDKHDEERYMLFCKKHALSYANDNYELMPNDFIPPVGTIVDIYTRIQTVPNEGGNK